MNSAIGVFGGMFDPVHDGHIRAAQYAMDKIGLKKVLLIPCGVPNHRSMAVSSGEDRVQMLKLAAAAESRLEVSDYETTKSGVSYTVDTLSWLKEEDPDRVLVLIVGMDAFNGLTGWHKWGNIFSLCNLLVLPRPGLALDEETAKAVWVDARRLQSAEELSHQDCGGLWIAAGFDHDVSSTGVRRQLQSGRRPDGVHEEVLKYIKEHRLYSHPGSSV